MLKYLFYVTVLCLALKPISADPNYVYQSDAAQYVADKLKNFQSAFESKVSWGYGQVQREYLATTQSYVTALANAKACNICCNANDETNRQLYGDTFRVSMQTCKNPTACSKVPEAIAKTLLVVQQIDTTGYNQQLNCADYACKLKAFQDTQSTLMKLCQDAMAFLGPADAETLSNPQCKAAVDQCFSSMTKGSANEMNKRIAEIQTCLGTVNIAYGYGQCGYGGSSAYNPYSGTSYWNNYQG